MTKYDEMVEAVAEKIGHCRVAGGLDDHDIARQVLEAVGITRESLESPPEPVTVTDLPTGVTPQE